MKLSRRSILTATGAGAIGLGAAACGGGGGADEDAPIDVDKSPSELSGEITLLTPDFTGTQRPALDDGIIAPFVEETGVKVTVDQVDWDKLNEKLTTSIAGGVIADVIMSGVGWTPPFANKGVFAQLPNDYVESLEFDDTVLISAKYDDEYYSLPQGLDLRFLSYHPEFFEAAGITEPPATIEELGQVADELTKDGVIGFDLFSTSLRQAWIFLLYAHGGTLFSEDGLTPKLHEEPGRKATEWILERMKNGSVDYDLQAAEGQPTPFAQKKSAIAITSTGVWPSWVDMTPELTEEGAVGTFLMPTTDGGELMFQGGTLISVSKRSKNQDAAVALVKHFLKPEMLGIANGATGKVPPTADIPDNEDIKSNLLASFALANLDKAGAAEGGTAAWMEIRGNLQPLIEACLTGKSTVDQMLADMKTLCEDAIGRL